MDKFNIDAFVEAAAKRLELRPPKDGAALGSKPCDPTYPPEHPQKSGLEQVRNSPAWKDWD